MPFSLNKLVIVGVGLIGGSVAAALKRSGQVGHVTGVGRSTANLERALARGVVDEVCADVADAARNADLVLIAVPVAQVPRILVRLREGACNDVVITDAGSTKRDFVDAVRTMFGDALPNVVPGHPIAGAEHTGVDAASADLFRDKRVVLTPLPETRPAAVDRVKGLWQACGARVSLMDAEHHDRVFSAVSHLPHLLAFALVEMIASRDNGNELFSFAAGGFRDFTRIAGSSSEMWTDICLANRDMVLRDVESYQRCLAELGERLRDGDADAVRALYEAARMARHRWIEGTS